VEKNGKCSRFCGLIQTLVSSYLNVVIEDTLLRVEDLRIYFLYYHGLPWRGTSYLKRLTLVTVFYDPIITYGGYHWRHNYVINDVHIATDFTLKCVLDQVAYLAIDTVFDGEFSLRVRTYLRVIFEAQFAFFPYVDM